MNILHKRDDGTFVIQLDNGWPYHVTQDDPFYAQVCEEAKDLDLTPEAEEPSPPVASDWISEEFRKLTDRIAALEARLAGDTK